MEQSYKEKYEQAIEKLRNFCRDYDTVSCLIDVKEELANLFPELAESEGEKTRKEIISHLQHEYVVKRHVSDVEYDRWIAWLERQGEHANFLSKIQVGDKVTRNEAGVLVNLSQLNRVAKPEENKGNIGGISSNWSEKDEAVLDALIRRLEGEDIYVSPHLAVECLKSIKGRVGCEANCTTTKEWSEEDKKKIDRIYLLISEAADEHAFGTTCRLIGDKECVELQEWLKSLRPHNLWKPSDEQMGCLSDAIEHYNSLGYPAPKLKELLDDLKKIKGEV